MPELPEVETIARALRQGGRGAPAVIGKHILGGSLLWERTLAEPSLESFRERLPGQIIQNIGRRGKFLILSLSRDFLLVHLRMSGDLLVEPASMPPAPHHRLIIDLEDGFRLAFNDARKFGRVWLTVTPETVLGRLGPEPLDDSFSVELLSQKLRESRRMLKPLLMDQSFLAGLGNIYTDEALHLARLHPCRTSATLSQTEVSLLWASIRQVLLEGIARSGASIDWVYRGGDFQNYLRVYRRTGEPCLTCGTPIARIIMGQRGTHYCPSCQLLPDKTPS